MSVLKGATRRNIPEDDILHSQRREILRSSFMKKFVSNKIQCYVCMSQISSVGTAMDDGLEGLGSIPSYGTFPSPPRRTSRH
jgi:hypothetical protein